MKIKDEISVYISFSKGIIQKHMSYKIGIFMKILGGLIQVMITCYLWNAVFNSSSSDIINGFTRNQMISYTLISYISMQIINITIEWTIADDIRSGAIAVNLIKPISYVKRILAESLGISFENMITTVIPIWIIFNIYGYINSITLIPDIGMICLYLISLILGYITIFLFNFIFALSSFYVTYIWGIISCKYLLISFFSGQLIPINFFPQIIKDALKFLPFSGMNYTPVMIYLKKIPIRDAIFLLCVQVIWIIILFALYKILWAKAIKKVSVLGG